LKLELAVNNPRRKKESLVRKRRTKDKRQKEYSEEEMLSHEEIV